MTMAMRVGSQVFNLIIMIERDCMGLNITECDWKLLYVIEGSGNLLVIESN
jgi:hypothetical protein